MTSRGLRLARRILLSLCGLLLAVPLAADVVRMRSGDILSGTVAGSSFMVETEQGLLEVPKTSISKIVVTGTRVRFELVDGTALEGTLESPTIQLDKDLFSRHLDVTDIESIALDAPRVSVPSGTPVPLVEAGPTVEERLAEVLDEKRALAEHFVIPLGGFEVAPEELWAATAM